MDVVAVLQGLPWMMELLVFGTLLQVGIPGKAPDQVGQPPCYDCEMYNVMHKDEPRHERLVSSQCIYPCKCSNPDIRCKAGVNIVRDGCECCYICARQQGDLCNYKDKCDEEKDLYCDFQMGDGQTGICRAKAAKTCEVDGVIYKDGEEFKLSCKQLCSCQNGIYSCTTLCPQEDRQPSSVHCKVPLLVEIKGQCCSEWVCPNSNSLPDEEDSLPSEYSDDWKDRTACSRESTQWSSCSATCDMGVSLRFTNDNEHCQPAEEKRLCFVRPCELDDSDRKGRKCKNTWREKNSIKFQYDGCSSLKEYRPKYCSTCKRRRCCIPEKTKTNPIQWECSNGEIVVYNFMWIKSCKCTDECP